MPGIENYVEQIRRATYGRDVREAIASGIEECYSDVTQAKTIADDSIAAAAAKAQEAASSAEAAATSSQTATAAKDTAVQKAGEASQSATDAAQSASEVSAVRDSIPADYTELSQSVVDLKSADNNYELGYLPKYIIKNSYVEQNGVIKPYTGWDRTDYIPVRKYSSFIAKTSVSSAFNVFFDENHEKIDVNFNINSTPKEIQVPDGAYYVMFSNTAAGMETLEAEFTTLADHNLSLLNDAAMKGTDTQIQPSNYTNYLPDANSAVKNIVHRLTGFTANSTDIPANLPSDKWDVNWENAILATFGNTATEYAKVQLFISKTNVYYRNYSGGEWSTWASIVDADNIGALNKITGKLTKACELLQDGGLPYLLVDNQYVDIYHNSEFRTWDGWSRTGYIYVGDAKQIAVNASEQSNYNSYYDANKNPISPFSVNSGDNFINIADNVQYIALSNDAEHMRQIDVRITKYRCPDYEYEYGNNVYVYDNIPETVYDSDNGLTYSVKDGIITLNGSLTSASFRKDFHLVNISGYHILNVEVLSGSYTGNLSVLKLPDISTYINGDNGAIVGHVNRLDYFSEGQHGFAISATSGTVFDHLRLRIWLVQGLLDKPFDLPGYNIHHTSAVGCDVGEYNAADYTHIGDGVTYSAFGNSLAVCKDGMIGKNIATDTVKFGLISDLHYVNHESFYKRIYSRLSDENIDFCIMTGDIIDSGYYRTIALHHQQLEQYKNSIKYLRCPNFPFAGNHDDDVAEFAHHGVVDYGNVRFIYFWADYDGTSEAGLVKPDEMAWIGQQLAQSKAKYNILMCHYAISTDTGFGWYIADSATRDAIKTLASTYGVKLYLNGHEHDHDISVGTAGTMKDINLPNGQYAYAICTIDQAGAFTATFYDASTDTVLKTVNVTL